MEPTGNGIGGDLFAIVWDQKSGKLHGLNASGRSPHTLTLEWFRKNNITRIPALGPLPVSVPGCVDGWYELHRRFGRLPMADLLAPAIRYAREGFPVSELIAYYWQSNARSLSKYPGFAEIFMPEGKTPAKEKSSEIPGWPLPWKPSPTEAGMFSTRGNRPKNHPLHAGKRGIPDHARL